MAKNTICLIIGDPVEHSISPQMHNACYKALGIDSEFIFIASRVTAQNLESVVSGLKVMSVRGITVTVPHKISVMPLLDNIDETARAIGAVNTIVNNNGKLTGYNTDWIGIAEPLKQTGNLTGKHVAILGAGGAAHAAVYAVNKLGAHGIVFNRTVARAKELAETCNCDYGSLEDVATIKQADVIINTTSVGLESNKSPIPSEAIGKHQIVFDIVYKPYETRLLQDAQEKGATTIHGTEMLLHQGIAQFELYTNQKAPVTVMRETIMENI